MLDQIGPPNVLLINRGGGRFEPAPENNVVGSWRNSLQATWGDYDQDGDPDGHCPGGNDCDDEDPTVSSLSDEVCGNFQDDDCDATVDEDACTTPAHDTCLDPLEIAQPGSYAMDTSAAQLDRSSRSVASLMAWMYS